MKTPDGTIYRYGSLTGRINSGGVTVSWLLDYVEDNDGNYIIYTYNRGHALMAYLTEISYGKNKNKDIGKVNTLTFTYENRFDPIPIYSISSTGNITQRLKNIICKTAGELYRKIELNYSDYHNFSTPTIAEYGADGAHSSNLLFNSKWFTGNYIYEKDHSVIKSPYKDFEDQTYMAADVNGNSISDLIGVFPYQQKIGNTTYYYKMVQIYNTEWKNEQWVNTPKNTHLLPADIDIDKNFKSYTTSNIALRLDGSARQWLIFPLFQKLNNISQIGFYIPATSTGYYSFGYNLEASSEAPLTALGDLTNDSRDNLIYLEKGHKSNIYPGKL